VDIPCYKNTSIYETKRCYRCAPKTFYDNNQPRCEGGGDQESFFYTFSWSAEASGNTFNFSSKKWNYKAKIIVDNWTYTSDSPWDNYTLQPSDFTVSYSAGIGTVIGLENGPGKEYSFFVEFEPELTKDESIILSLDNAVAKYADVSNNHQINLV
jgi:hypothetical protein